MSVIIPEMLYLEPTNICNANCIFCAYQFDKRPKQTMDFDLFKETAYRYRQVGGTHIGLTPFAGEIFLDSDILNKINYLKDLGFHHIHTYTNALSLHKFQMKDILRSGLTTLYISTAPLDREIYFKIFRNRSYKRLLINIQNLLDEFRTTENRTIESITIDFRSNMSLTEIQCLPDFIEVVQPRLIDGINISSMTVFDGWMGQIKQDDLLDGMKIKSPNFPKTKPCMRLNILQVLSNGDTRVCGCRYNNNAKEDVFNVGNALHEDIIDMYNKGKVHQLKSSFYENSIPEECKLCSWYETDNPRTMEDTKLVMD